MYIQGKFIVTKVDYTKYTLEDLLECQQNIDRNAYPDRANEIDLLIKDRLKNRTPRRVTMADENGNIAAIKKGRAPSLGQGLSELIGGTLFGIIWISTTGNSGPQYWSLIGYFVILSSVIGGGYHIYNALAKNRFTAQDIVSPSKEPDPFNKLMGFDKNDNNKSQFCTGCGSPVEITDKFCSSCGQKARA
ncbi:hypothetical protein A1QK_13005 [Vibrio genomosp. F10 str. 9ZD137]|nr:hypothetical protein A1QK_13005 [Vibrio genomosp. F10 str. 9ZD137]